MSESLRPMTAEERAAVSVLASMPARRRNRLANSADVRWKLKALQASETISDEDAAFVRATLVECHARERADTASGIDRRPPTEKPFDLISSLCLRFAALPVGGAGRRAYWAHAITLVPHVVLERRLKHFADERGYVTTSSNYARRVLTPKGRHALRRARDV